MITVLFDNYLMKGMLTMKGQEYLQIIRDMLERLEQTQMGAIEKGASMIADTEAAKDSYALGLRLTVALSVGAAIILGVMRIIKGWPIHVMIAGGYVLVVIMTAIAPREIIGLAYDSGGVTTSTITVPLVTALGVGLASSIKGRNPMLDGFGLIAFASLLPMIFVMLYGMLT